MRIHGDRHVIACPLCKTLIFGEKLIRHFKTTHKRQLPWDEAVQIAKARKNRVAAQDADAFVERAYKIAENCTKIERTPRSMRGWDSNNPGRKISSGPLGPDKG